MGIKVGTSGFVFWPVGCGDSTTILVEQGVVMQVDLNHLECSEEEGDPHARVIDELIELLPKIDGRPYLSVFALTHPDQDHCRGFARLLDEVTIGEIWFTPRVFAEYKVDLCDDAVAFRDEATRRVAATKRAGLGVKSGNRVRVVGYDTLLEEEEFEGFPRELLTIPGTAIVELDGADRSAAFRAFVHAPFKDDADGDRNETSLGLQVTLTNGDAVARALLFGDLHYPILKRIFEVSDAADLAWNVFLAPHHCSKSVMFHCGDEDEEEQLQQDVLDMLEKNMGDPGYIIVSSLPIPATNEPEENPPHAVAKEKYEEIARNGVLCTHEHPNSDKPEAIVFMLKDGTFSKNNLSSKAHVVGGTVLARAVVKARGAAEPPGERVGFGR